MKKIFARIIMLSWIVIPIAFVTYWNIWPQFLLALGCTLFLYILIISFFWAGEHWNG